LGFNVIKDTIEQYLDEVAGNHDDEGVAELLRCALLRPLCKELSRQERPDDLERVTALPKGAPGWLRESFNQDIPVYGFAPRAEMREGIAHVADWLAAALVNKEEWLNDLDERGRPKKLGKLGSLDRAVKEADRAMLLAVQKGAAQLYEDEEGHEQTETVFEGGYRMVRLLSPSALDKESAAMGHCIGAGGYDGRVRAGTHAYYSLRDPFGKSHATLEVALESNALLQCQGKENKLPVAKYMPFIQTFIKEHKLKLGDAPARYTGLIEQDGEYYDARNLPENLRVGGDIDLRDIAITSLPGGLTVGQNLYLSGTAITELPEGLTVGGFLDLSGTAITSLPEGLTVGQNLYLSGTAITELPEGLTVGGGLYLSGTAITSLPEGLTVGGFLDLSGTAVTSLPGGLTVGGGLDLRGTAVTSLPEGLTVGGGLYLGGTAITELPEGLTVGGMVFSDEPAAGLRRPAGGVEMRPS